MRRKASQAEGSRYAKAWKQETHSYFTEARTWEGEAEREAGERSQGPDPGGGRRALGARPRLMLSSARSRKPACEGDWVISVSLGGSA